MNKGILKRASAAVLASLVMVTTLATALPVHAEEEVTSEQTRSIQFSGQIIELSSTTAPTTIIVRENPAGEFTDYTVDVTESTTFNVSMEDWIVGDAATVIGTLNENTGVVTASYINNLSMNPRYFRGLNGWIDSIAEDGSSMQVQWNGALNQVNITDSTNLVGDQGPYGSVEDFQVGDRVRVRLTAGTQDARIIIILRRGPKIYNLARTRGFYGELHEIDTDSNTLNITLLNNPHLLSGDVNNLVGVEGDTVTVTWDDNTEFRRKFFGETSEDELVSGDILQIVGRVNDDGTISARMIRDTDIFRLSVGVRYGEITSVDTDANTVTVVSASDANSATWTISYSDDTPFWIDGTEGTESDLAVGLHLRARGTANILNHTVTADKIAIYDETKPVVEHPARLRTIIDEVNSYFSEQEST